MHFAGVSVRAAPCDPGALPGVERRGPAAEPLVQDRGGLLALTGTGERVDQGVLEDVALGGAPAECGRSGKDLGQLGGGDEPKSPSTTACNAQHTGATTSRKHRVGVGQRGRPQRCQPDRVGRRGQVSAECRAANASGG